MDNDFNPGECPVTIKFLQERLDFYKILIDNTYDWEYLISPDDEFLYVSPSCERITGYKPEEFYCDRELLEKIIHREDRPGWQKHLNQRISGKVDCGEFKEFRIITKWGKTEWIGHECQSVFDKQGDFVGTRGSNRLITKQKHLEEELRDLAKVHGSILSQSPIAVVCYDEEGSCIYANDAVAKIVGAPSEAILKQNFHTIESWKSSGLYDCAINSLQTNTIKRMEIEVRTSFGKLAWLDCTVVSLKEGSRAKLMVLAEDIADRKQAEIQLKQSEEKFRAITSQIEEGICIYSRKGDFYYVNPAFCRMFGFNKKEILELKFMEMLAERSIAIEPFLPPEKETTLYNRDVKFRRKDGAVFSAAFSTKTIDIENQTYFLSTIRDISQIIDYEESLKNSNLAKDKFISIISHDLRAPFNALMGLSELMPMMIKEKEYDGLSEMAEHIHLASSRAYKLLDNLLKWAQSQSGTIDCTPKNENLATVVASAISVVTENAELKDININNLTKEDITAFIDENTMETVVRNILANAIKFTPEEGTVEISTTTNADTVQLRISDTGIGMAPELISRLFKLESSISRTGTKGERGTGLGLLIAKEFVERNQGSLTVESMVGKGSVFTITMPLGKLDNETKGQRENGKLIRHN